MAMQVKITDGSGKVTPGTCVIEYRGFELSVSTITRFPEVRIFGGQRHPGRDMTESVMGDQSSIPANLPALARIYEAINKYLGV